MFIIAVMISFAIARYKEAETGFDSYAVHKFKEKKKSQIQDIFSHCEI